MAEPTVQTRLFPAKGRGPMEPKESEFQWAVVETAQLLKWRVAHFRPAWSQKGFRTPVAADGAGWPDLVMLRGETLLAVELKSGGRKPTAEQIAWLEAFDKVPGCRAAVWTTRDPWSGIEAALRDL